MYSVGVASLSFPHLLFFFCFVSFFIAEELLFRWSPHRRKLLGEFWEDFVLVMETLEENQVGRKKNLRNGDEMESSLFFFLFFLMLVSPGSCRASSSEPNRRADPNNGGRRSR